MFLVFFVNFFISLNFLFSVHFSRFSFSLTFRLFLSTRETPQKVSKEGKRKVAKEPFAASRDGRRKLEFT